MLFGVKILFEQAIQLMLLISSVYKDNIFSLVYLLAILYYMLSRRITAMVVICYVVGIVMILQYALVLTNLTSATSPMEFPYPFIP